MENTKYLLQDPDVSIFIHVFFPLGIYLFNKNVGPEIKDLC